MGKGDKQPLAKLRLDKWLWAARFFKTRAIATEAINGGKVHVDGTRAKPSKEIEVGASIRIHKNELEWTVNVAGLSKHRRPAAEATLLYTESEDSITQREAATETRRQQYAAHPQAERKPSKRDRRLIHRFKQSHDD